MHTLLASIRKVIRGNKQATAYGLIALLNPTIRGWANFHQHAAAKATFVHVDTAICKALWRWARRRHPKKDTVLWAAVAGGLGAIYRLASLAVWMERRPVAFVILESAQPLLILAFVVPLVASGAGLEGAIAGTAIGTAISTLLTVGALRGSFELCFEPREAVTIMRLGAPRIPVHASFWTINSAQVFFLSRYVSHTDLGIFALAQRAGIVVSLLPTGFRRALRPLKRTAAFAAVEDQYGSEVARGQQLGYFLLVTLASLLAVTLLADPIVSLAPPAYADAAPLIPLMAAAMTSPTVFRMLQKSAKYRRKRQIFIYCAVAAGLVFIAGCLTFIPWLGLAGAPVAMMVAFAAPGTYIFYLSQSGREPIAMPYRPLAVATILAAVCAVSYYAIDPSGIVLQIALGLVLLVAWAVLCLLTGVVPSYHRRPLIHMAMSAIGRGTAKFDPESALRELDAEDRETLRMAIVERRPVDEIAAGRTATATASGSRTPCAVRRSGGRLRRAPSHDAKIGEYLFSTSSVATRDATAKRLLTDGVDAADLHALEAVVDDLERCPGTVGVRGGRRVARYSLRRITIRSGSTSTSTARCPAQCSVYAGSSSTAGSSHRPKPSLPAVVERALERLSLAPRAAPSPPAAATATAAPAGRLSPCPRPRPLALAVAVALLLVTLVGLGLVLLVVLLDRGGLDLGLDLVAEVDVGISSPSSAVSSWRRRNSPSSAAGTSSWCAIQASVRPSRTHARI